MSGYTLTNLYTIVLQMLLSDQLERRNLRAKGQAEDLPKFHSLDHQGGGMSSPFESILLLCILFQFFFTLF